MDEVRGGKKRLSCNDSPPKRVREKKIDERRGGWLSERAAPRESRLQSRRGCDRTAEPEEERRMFSAHAKLCITVIPSTAHMADR